PGGGPLHRPRAAHLTGPARHAGRRVPAADRTPLGRLMASITAVQPGWPSSSLSFRAYQCWMTVYRRIWRSSIWSSLLGPLFYLGAMGLGLGSLVNRHGTAARLTGLAFAAPIAAWAMTLQSENSFAYLFRFGMMPLMLFSGTFFPLSQLPGWLRLLAYATPLWHGVDLCRMLSLGHVDLP